MATTSSNILCLNFNEDQGRDDLLRRMYLCGALNDISKLFLFVLKNFATFMLVCMNVYTVCI